MVAELVQAAAAFVFVNLVLAIIIFTLCLHVCQSDCYLPGLPVRQSH